MRISDWSSDVCSSDVFAQLGERIVAQRLHELRRGVMPVIAVRRVADILGLLQQQAWTRRSVAGPVDRCAIGARLVERDKFFLAILVGVALADFLDRKSVV